MHFFVGQRYELNVNVTVDSTLTMGSRTKLNGLLDPNALTLIDKLKRYIVNINDHDNNDNVLFSSY